jgi:flagellar protein FliO/FliZ
MRIFSLFILLCAGSLQAATLKDVQTQAHDGVFETHLVFDGPISKDQASLDFINETVQVNLSNIDLAQNKITKTIKNEKVNNVYIYKTGKNEARARIIYKKGVNASEFQGGTSIDAQGNELVIKVDSNPQAATAATTTAPATISDDDLKAASEWIANADKKEAQKIAAPAVAEATDAKKEIAKKESEIPVLANSKAQEEIKKPISSTRVILSLGLVLGLIAGFSFFMKKVLKKTPLTKNSQIKILTQYYVGPKKSLAIVQVAGESILLGITDHNINMIKTLALLDEEIPQDTPKDFSKSLKDMFKKNIKEEAAADSTESDSSESDEFAFSKIKDVISGRLKNMKEI